MRIAMLCHNYPPHTGGLEVMVQHLVRELAARHQVTVVTSAWRGASGVSHEDGCEVHRLPAIHRTERWGVPYPIPIGRGSRRALAALRHAEVVHGHGALYATTLLAVQASHRAGAPLVLTEHVGFVQYPRAIVNRVESVAWRTIGNRTVGRARALTVYNRRVHDWMAERYPGKPIRFIVNGVDTDAFRPRAPGEMSRLRSELGLPVDRPLVLFVGRDAAKKNLSALLDLRRNGYALVICGAERGFTGEGVIDLGVLPHGRMAALYGCVDVMVLPSTGEGFPLAAQEAAAAGLPLVVLWDPGYADSLSRDVVMACGSLNEIGPALDQLVGDRDARTRLSRAARDWALTKWSWRQTADEYEALYEQVRA